jgi:RecJ-like exonuclease
MKKRELKPGHTYCEICNGIGNRGYIEFTAERTYIYKDYDDMLKRRHSFHVDPLPCENCAGTGQLDWIEIIVGKRKLLE